MEETQEQLVGKKRKRKAGKKVDGDPSVIPEKATTLVEVQRKERKKNKTEDPTPCGSKEVDSSRDEEVKTPSKRQKKKRSRDEARDRNQFDNDSQLKQKKSKGDKETDLREGTLSQVKKHRPKEKAKEASQHPMAGDNPQSRTDEGTRNPRKHRNKTGFSNPSEDDDTGLSTQARKALVYAFCRFHDAEGWKFNKARQNWLIRNFWSSKDIPEIYENLVIQYLSTVQGNTHEHLIKTCRLVLEEPDSALKEQQADEPQADDQEKQNIGGSLIEVPSLTGLNKDHRTQTRAVLLLEALIPKANSASSSSPD